MVRTCGSYTGIHLCLLGNSEKISPKSVHTVEIYCLCKRRKVTQRVVSAENISFIAFEIF